MKATFTYEGIELEAEGEVSNPHDPWFEIDIIYHKGEDIMNLIDQRDLGVMENQLNYQNTEEKLLQDYLNKVEG